MSGRNWCFTLNNPDGLLDVEFEQWDGLRYAVYQHEVGENGTEHFQGFVQLDRVQRLSRMISMIPKAHWEVMRGTADQARAYCMKEDSRLDGPWEFGSFTTQGARSDIASFKAAIDNGASDISLWDSHPNLYLRYGKMLTHVRNLRSETRNWVTEVHIVYGKPGTGKTHWAEQQIGDKPFYRHSSAMAHWFENYHGEEDVIIDEYNGWIPWTVFLEMLDKYKCTLQGKGLPGGVNWKPKRIYITTNHSPLTWYGKREDSEAERDRKYPWGALERRVTSWNRFLEGPGFVPKHNELDANGNWNVTIRRSSDFNTIRDYF